jgi:hypothetical protein
MLEDNEVSAERGTIMINNISEGALRVATKIDPSGAIHEKEVNQQKANHIREARPVEKTGQGNQADAHNAEKDQTTGKYLLNDKRVVFEKYDRNGDLILRIPPSQTPVDEVV